MAIFHLPSILKSATAFNLMVRIPGWAQNTAIPSSLYQF